MMKSLKISCFSLLTLSLFGCATVERAMSGKIGCPSEDIQILETNPGWGVVSTTWTAACHDQVYICSLRPGAERLDHLDDMNCAQSHSKSEASFSEDLGHARNESFEQFVDRLNEKATRSSLSRQ